MKTAFKPDDEKHFTHSFPSRFVVDEFLEQLDPVAIKRLCELYKMDFLVFGFSHERCKFGVD